VLVDWEREAVDWPGLDVRRRLRDGDGDALLGSFEGAQDGGLGFAGRHPLGVEAEAKQANQEEKQAGDGEEQLDTALELQDSHS